MNRWVWCILLCACSLSLHAREYGDSALYQGMSVKLDIAMPIIEAARSKGRVQDYEVALNCRLKNRWYPTLELGYALANCTLNGGTHVGQGGFARLGVDLSALKKGKAVDCLMVGLRFGGSYQGYDLTHVKVAESYWPTIETEYLKQTHWDAWGELVAGCQVQIAKGFQMGWFLRMKMLITRRDKLGGPMPYYVPGFGYRSDTNWGFNYYIGYKF